MQSPGGPQILLQCAPGECGHAYALDRRTLFNCGAEAFGYTELDCRRVLAVAG